MQRADRMASPIPRLISYEDVEIMVVARPLRGAESMGAATVGKGHRSTTYTGVRGPEMLKGKRSTQGARPRACTVFHGTRPDAPHGIYRVRCCNRR